MAKAPVNPNLITLARLPLAPLAVAFLVGMPNATGVGIALALSIILEATDALDGWVARKYDAVTDFGKLFDPFSDAFARFTLFLGLWAIGCADLWMILLIFYRDSSVGFFRSIAATNNVVMAARPTGKIKAIVQAIGVNLILLLLLLGYLGVAPTWVESAPWWIMLVVTAVTTLSFFDYLIGALPVLREAWHGRPAK
ncbi:MAG: CDP-alcohol phosphatidyltransferase family protein [Myxococcota bacterium]